MSMTEILNKYTAGQTTLEGTNAALAEMDAVLALCGEQLAARHIADLWDEQHPDEKLVRAPGFEI